jgi:hypothetical protein
VPGGARQVRGHRLLDHHGQPSPERPHPEVGSGPVVREDENRVQVGALEERVVRGVEVHVSVLSTQALAEPWRRLGGRHQPADLAAGGGGEVAPDVIVTQPQNADPKPGRHAPARARYAGQV